MNSPHFRPALFQFLRDLKANNEREWFQANQDRYVREVKEPALRFITDFGPLLQQISPHFRADPRPSGGSLFRIHRDIRFSKDPSPYKTHAGLHFRHEAGKTAYTPGFYLHLEPAGCFVGVGLWHPDTATLKRIRDKVASDPQAWLAAVQDRRFRKMFTVEGDRLQRPPRGYPADHVLAEVLKLKDFTALSSLRQDQVTKAGFLREFAGLCAAGAPLVRYICEALDQPY